jgi:hypothetical protein
MTHSTPKKISAMPKPVPCERMDSIERAWSCSGVNAFK